MLPNVRSYIVEGDVLKHDTQTSGDIGQQLEFVIAVSPVDINGPVNETA
jgi:hypothetical protein